MLGSPHLRRCRYLPACRAGETFRHFFEISPTMVKLDTRIRAAQLKNIFASKCPKLIVLFPMKAQSNIISIR